jgi:hypothetical protein
VNVKLVVYIVTAGNYEGLRKNHRFRRNVEGCGETHVGQSVGHDTPLCTEVSFH